MKINVKNGYGEYWAKTVNFEHDNIKIDIGRLDAEDSVNLAFSLLDSCIDLISFNHETTVGNKYEGISSELYDIYEKLANIIKENKQK